jgi:flavin-dependent dehydrogenase
LEAILTIKHESFKHPMPEHESEHYDVIIVGAGPAGLACAQEFLSTSLKCLIIEKNSVCGKKVCAGGITALADSFHFPEDQTRSFKANHYFLNEKYHEITLRNNIKTIDREVLAQLQYQNLTKATHLHFRFNTTVLKIEGKTVYTRQNRFTCRYLIGADGANSLVRKYLGLKNKICMGIYAQIKTTAPRLIWHLEYKKLHSGYIWEFPHKTHTNVGIFYYPRQLRSSQAESRLKKYLEHHNYQMIDQELKRGIMNTHYQGYHFEDIFLVGEAAGLVSKLTGEGISFALVSGREIAKKILNPSYHLKPLRKVIAYKFHQDVLWMITYYLPLLRPITYPLFIVLMKTKWFQRFYGL